MRARDLMTTALHVVTPGESVARAAEIMRDADVGIVPVVDSARELHLRGVITDRDIAVRCVAARHNPERVVRDHMTPLPLLTVAADEDAHDVLGKMAEAQVRRVPVVDSDNRLVGVIAQADVATKLGIKEPLHVARTIERISEPAPALV